MFLIQLKILKKFFQMQILKIKSLSVNKAYQGRRFKTKEHNIYLKNLSFLLKPLDFEINKKDKLKLLLTVGFSNKKSDLDNCLKPFLDALQWKYNFDDSQVYEILLKKEIVKKKEEFIKFDIIIL